MTRIGKAHVNEALEIAAKTLIRVGGDDGVISRAEVKDAIASNRVAPAEAPLVDAFFRFVDHRDFKAGAKVTEKDVRRAVQYAKEHLIAKYDLDKNGLSDSEIAKMSHTGKCAVELARHLKEAAAFKSGVHE